VKATVAHSHTLAGPGPELDDSARDPPAPEAPLEAALPALVASSGGAGGRESTPQANGTRTADAIPSAAAIPA
jgi:hypothetical protein